MLNKRKALIGYGVYTLGKPLAKRSCGSSRPKAPSARSSLGGIAAAVAAAGATIGGLVFWRKTSIRRRGVDRELTSPTPSSSEPASPAARRRASSPRAARRSSSSSEAESAPAPPGETAASSSASPRPGSTSSSTRRSRSTGARGRRPDPARPRERPMLLLAVEDEELAARARVRRRGRRQRRSTCARTPGSRTTSPAASWSKAAHRSTPWARPRRRPRPPGVPAPRFGSAARRSGSSSRAAGSRRSPPTTASSRCGRVVVASGPRLRFLLRTAGVDLPVSSSRGWLLETGRVDPPPPYAIEQAAWPEQEEMGPLLADPTLGEVAAGAAEEPGLVSLLLGGRPAGPLSDRHVAPPLAAGGARGPGHRAAPRRARRPRGAPPRRGARRRRLVRAAAR